MSLASEPRVPGTVWSATGFTLGTAVASVLLILGIVTPLAAMLCERTLTAMEVSPLPPPTIMVLHLSPWAFVLAACLGAAALIGKERWIGRSLAVKVNVAATVAALVLGGFAVLAVTAPIFQLMGAIAV